MMEVEYECSYDLCELLGRYRGASLDVLVLIDALQLPMQEPPEGRLTTERLDRMAKIHE